MTCDLDGDGLKDIVQLTALNLSIFYQDAKSGFAREPQQSYRLEPRPSVIWTARLNKQKESLLVMTSDEVSELYFSNRTTPPALRQIIKQPTVIPEVAENTHVQHLPLSVETGRDQPLLLVPAANGLQVWQHRDKWVQVQVIANSVAARQRPSLVDPGYSTSLGFDFSVSDVNSDKRDDLIVRNSRSTRNKAYNVYLQQTNGLFTSEPELTYADKVEPRAWLCWADLNHDGKVDLIKTVGISESSFVPGVPSSKVLASTYMADEHGKIPNEPQQVFRKNDFNVTLPVVDVDGDGFLDLVLFYRHMDSREDVTKMVTAKQLDYNLRFHFYLPGIGFPKQATCQHDVAFHLDRDELMGWIGHENYEAYVKLGGDFSGDGRTDLLVRERDDEISAYFFISREKGFSPKPDLRFNCPEQIDGWKVEDMNHDGVNDLIVRLRAQNTYRIFISQK